MSAPGVPTMVIGRYSLHAQIASGGMGVVHFATVNDGGEIRVLAAKRLHPHLRHDQTFAMMLLDEARLAVSVQHPNVVRVIDVVSTATDLLLVMEYVPGLSVYELMTNGRADRQRTPIPLPVALTIAVEGLRGLHAAHEAVGEDGQPLNLVHRDISPQNLLVDASGVTKLTDFGVAKAVGRLRSTRDGSIRGKIAYMSPEQVSDSGVDPRSDIYSFAIVVWELIAGRSMFEADSDVALFGKAMRGPTERLSEIVPDIPPALDAVIWRALARDPRRRFPTARAFADALVDAFGAVDHGWVAQWIRERAGALLRSREKTVEELVASSRLENMDTLTISGPVDVTNVPMMIDAPPSATQIHAPALQRSRSIQMAMLGVVTASVAVAVLMLATSNKTPPLPAPPPLPAAQPDPTSAPAVVTPPAVAPAMPGSASAKPVAASPSPKARPVVPKKPEKDPKADCNPPYTEDETGKHFKPWCLR